MTDYDRGYARSIPAGRADMAVDAGLRAFMLGVYNKLAIGLVLSGALAWVTSSVPAVRDLLFVTTPAGQLAGYTILGWAVAFAPLILILFSGFALKNPSPAERRRPLLDHRGPDRRLAGHRVPALHERVGRLDLLRDRGLVRRAQPVRLHHQAGPRPHRLVPDHGRDRADHRLDREHLPAVAGPDVRINALGVLIFAGLIAFDTQRLKMTYYQLGGNQAAMGVATSFGALSLYINFINLFQFLLAFMGNRE
jgi:FtsH-binding integral membrane protein